MPNVAMQKKLPNFAFIDSQNLNLGIKSLGWQLDWRKFRLYLTNKYHIEVAYLFIGMMPGNEALYDSLQASGYRLIFKPTTEYSIDGKVAVKGNVDAEMVLYAAAKVINDYDKALIISGDGDFACLIEYLEEKKKLLHLVVPNDRYSKLLGRFTKKIVRMSQLKRNVEYKKTKSSGRSKP
ncbi:NYN domain-containing protein [bacterium]|nr:NYN domain-containing protein [bacterium]NBX98555.1 NYN domain-containing protein [bacterium]NDC93812.1 NYN domain-containing protein [bacterium]NDD83602.1 NYN domain-containing protein [bacterium]NDG28758.1 NYN domain-containing protein [bacterium]